MPTAPPLAGVLRAIARHHTATAELFNELAAYSGAPVAVCNASGKAVTDDFSMPHGRFVAGMPGTAQEPSPDPSPEPPADAPDFGTVDPETPLSREDQQAIFDQIKALPAAHLAKFVADFKAEFGATRGRNGRETVQDRIVQWKHALWFNDWVLANGEGT